MHSSKMQSFTEELNWKSSKSSRECDQVGAWPHTQVAYITGHNAGEFGDWWKTQTLIFLETTQCVIFKHTQPPVMDICKVHHSSFLWKQPPESCSTCTCPRRPGQSQWPWGHHLHTLSQSHLHPSPEPAPSPHRTARSNRHQKSLGWEKPLLN